MAAITYPLSETEAAQEVRALLNEATASFWTAEEISNLVLQATMDVSAKLHCYQARDTTAVTLVANTFEYNQPTGCLKVLAAMYKSSSTIFKGLVRIHPMMVGHLAGEATGEPVYYYHGVGGKVGIWPIPTSSEAAKTVEIIYSKHTSAIANIPDQYQNLVIWLAVALALLKDKKFGAASQYYSMYLNSLTFHRADIVEYAVDASDMLKVPDTLIKGNAG